MVPGLYEYPNAYYSTTSSSQRESPIPSSQQQLHLQTPEERSQTRGSSGSRGNKLRKPPPSSNQSRPTFTHTGDVPMGVLSPVPLSVSQNAMTPSARVQNTDGYILATPQTPPQRSRHNGETQVQYTDIPPIPQSFPATAQENYPLAGQDQAYIVPSSRDSNRGRVMFTEPIASSDSAGSRHYEQQRGRKVAPQAEISTAYNDPRRRTNRDYTLPGFSNSSAYPASPLHSQHRQQVLSSC
jgi:hypothetical protein